jgi:diguanylate cyclase
MPERKSSEIARETLKLLAKRRQEPSPENYKALYDEVAGNGEEKRPRATSPINGWNNVQALQEPLAHLVESSLHGQAAEGSDLRRQATQITAFLRQPVLSLDTLKTMLETFNRRLDVDNEEYGEIQAGQGELLQLILRNIGVLTIDDHWLQGQTESLLAASTPPMSLRRLNALHDRMVEVIGKQKEAKQHLIEARDHMTGMIEAFLGTLRRIAACNEAHYGVIETCSRQMNKATTLEDITPVMREAFIATRVMADEALAMHSELSMIRQKAESTDAEIDRLRHQLDHLSALARHDALTGALNRRGLDEALEREISAAVRRGRVLSLALLDVDNFKAFNDRMGHEAGDGALLHLVEVVRECMRPQDVVARYGGEEFVLLLPETELNEALQALTRLQRELTQRLFLRDNEKILITFSAGVTQLVAGDTPGEALRRADQAMYLAKGAGKNRVQSA